MTGSRPRGLLLVGHGTRSPAGVAQFGDLLRRVAELLPDRPVAGGFIELAPPPLTEAAATLAAVGCGEIDVVPLVLVAAGHAKGDIPAALARERLRQPGLRFHYGRPLGPHAELLAALERRLDEVLRPSERAETTVLLVGRGATDPDANAEVAKVSRLLQEGRGLAGVETAFISLADPGVPAGLERCRRLGAGRVVVLPYFLFDGVLPDRVRAQADAWADERPEVQVRTAAVLGASDGLADLVVVRAAEAAAGRVTMSCDTCMYRTPLPGFAHRVGAPQTPHDHPTDPATGRHRHEPGPGHRHESGHRHDSGHLDRHEPAAHGRPGAVPVALLHHGDAEVGDGLLDAAVNVRLPAPPPWLRAELAATLDQLGRYPDPATARAAVAARHRRGPDEVLLTAGAAEAFTLLARTLRPTRAVAVHPSFTEPEAALLAAGHRVDRLVLAPPYRFDPGLVPVDADLVVLGNPTNPTSVLHQAGDLAALARPGRTLVVDEAFLDAVPGEPQSLAARGDLAGLVVVRSLTKTWGLAGLRVGYLLAAPALVARLAAGQPAWAVSSPALAALHACSQPAALAEATAAARRLAAARDRLATQLAALPGVQVLGAPAGPFLLLQVPDGRRVWTRLRELGVAVRRGETFPGLGPDHLRVAVRESEATNGVVVQAFDTVLRGGFG